MARFRVTFPFGFLPFSVALESTARTVRRDALAVLNTVLQSIGRPAVRRLPALTIVRQERRVFINRVGNGYRETVSDYSNFSSFGDSYFKEAKKDLAEYRVSDSQGYFYTSSRPCENWR